MTRKRKRKPKGHEDCTSAECRIDRIVDEVKDLLCERLEDPGEMQAVLVHLLATLTHVDQARPIEHVIRFLEQWYMEAGAAITDRIVPVEERN